MNECLYLIVCEDDDGMPVQVTRRIFRDEEKANKYRDGIAPGRKPQKVCISSPEGWRIDPDE